MHKYHNLLCTLFSFGTHSLNGSVVRKYYVNYFHISQTKAQRCIKSCIQHSFSSNWVEIFRELNVIRWSGRLSFEWIWPIFVWIWAYRTNPVISQVTSRRTEILNFDWNQSRIFHTFHSFRRRVRKFKLGSLLIIACNIANFIIPDSNVVCERKVDSMEWNWLLAPSIAIC